MAYLYKVTRQFARGGETAFAGFSDKNDAELFIETKLKSDRALNVKTIYHLYEGLELIQSFDPADSFTGTGSSGGSGMGKQSSASFKPTPFNTSPRPSGSPHGWMKDEDEEK